MGKKSKLVIGLTGNPNTGKSTLFNVLTGARQHVGNWPGKTVERKDGDFTYKSEEIKLVDLPGSYSLTAYTQEESVTADFIHEEKPDVVVQILDTQNLERNLFVTIQLIELQAPLVLALNMADLAKKNGIEIDEKQLSLLLNVPIVIIDAKRKKGIDKLMDTVLKQAKNKKRSHIKLTYGTEINDELEKIRSFFTRLKINTEYDNFSWITLKLLEGDTRVEQRLIQEPYYNELKFLIQKSVIHLERIFKKDVHNILANTRYGFIRGLCREVLKQERSCKKQNFSDKVDCLVLNRFLGIPIFLVIVWLMSQAAFLLSNPFMNWIESFIGFAGGAISALLASWGFSLWVISFIVDGVIGGVGGIMVFIPIIGILFFIMALLEDSGYMARVAYIMDKFMHRIGLHGKAFIPLILGLGCNVPGIMATRTLETKRDRLQTILINPFISCGSRLPVYALFAGVFFSAYQGWIIFSLYFFGVMVAIVMGFIFKKIFSRSLSSPFVIELPSYRWPAIAGLLIHAWEKVWIFMKKAGTIILVFSIIIWGLASFPVGVEYGSQKSFAGQIGVTISPVFEPLGFGNWKSSVVLMFGFVAKEVIVGTFGALYGVEDTPGSAGASSLTDALQNDFTPLSAYAFMVFVLLYVPCIAVLAVVRKETNSWKWPLLMIFYTLSIAWIMAFFVYQGGRLLGFT